MTGKPCCDDPLPALSDFPAEGNLLAAEVQNSFTLPILNGTTVTWGGQLHRDVAHATGAGNVVPGGLSRKG